MAEQEDIAVRAATQFDIPVLRDFEQGVIAAERPFAVNLKPDPIQYYSLEDLLASSQAALLVAEADGELIGSGYARIEAAKDYFVSDRFAYLGFMYVDPAWRGRGVIQRIMDELIGWCQGQGILEFRLDVYAGNEAAIRAYRKAGFNPNLVEMIMLKDDDAT